MWGYLCFLWLHSKRKWEELNAQVNILYEQGKYPEAVPKALEALRVAEATFGSEHDNVGISLNNLASLYKEQGKYAEAEPLYKRSLAIAEKALGPEHPNVATSLNNLAELYQHAGQVRRSRAPLQAFAGDLGEGPGAGASRRGHQPQQPGGSSTTTRASTRKLSRSISARWPSGRRPWGRSIPTWP